MVTVTKAVAILHNKVTEKRRDGYVSRTRMAAGGQAAGGGGAAVLGGMHGAAGGNTAGGNGGAAAPGGDGSAGGDLVAVGGVGGVAGAGAAGGQAAGGGGSAAVLGVCTVLPPATPAAEVEERPPSAVIDPPAAIWLRVGVLGELQRRPLPPAVRRLAVVLRECMTMETALWGAVIPPPPLRPPVHA